ncbi:MAG: NUDIX hydrolase, partial [Anaerolineae bacterium]|nr:NUDIX hydrolase [Anaerolineae bacterium]
ETGFEAEEWTPMGSYRVDASRGAGIAHFFLARQAHRVGEPDSDDLEEQELLLLTREEVQAALVSGDFKVLPWATIVSLALAVLEG